MAPDVFMIGRARTPIGSLGGRLSTVPAPQLAAHCIKAALQRSRVPPDKVNEVILGNVISAGLGQNPARQAALQAGIPVCVGATTINKVCGSGLKAVMLAGQSIQLGEAEIAVAGGMENMSLAPYLLPNARTGYRLGNGVLIDSLIHDGLRDAYDDKHMGAYGERCAAKYQFSRAAQDDFAVRSYERARKAIADGIFTDEIVPIPVPAQREPRWSLKMKNRLASTKQNCGRSGPPSIRKAPLPPAMRPALTTALRRWLWLPITLATHLDSAQQLASSAPPRLAPSRNGSPRLPSAPSNGCLKKSAGRSTTRICLKSTKHSPPLPWPPRMN